MSNKSGLIAAAGYTGSTSERTWKERMKKLEELGLIKIASGKHGDISCVLILNPHKVLRRHKDLGTPGFDQKNYNCLLEQIADYGMLDFQEPKKEEAQAPSPATRLNPPPPPLISTPSRKQNP
jgi:hypothetical protein